MKVLMFGWEFPPHITGGLGTACYGITKSLAKQNVDIIFVVPKTFGNEDRRYATLQDAGEIPSRYMGSNAEDYWKKVRYTEIISKLNPYSDPDEDEKLIESSLNVKAGEKKGQPDFIPFSGKYGADLWNEVDRYSRVTSILAQKEKYDVIHSHEWLTFPAAISAKKLSDKPLIVHIHATEFDRNSGNINRNIYNIEKEGMEYSDKVITVSNYTRDIVINKYSINPDKVVTIHNAIDKPAAPNSLRPVRNSKEKIVTFLGRITFQKGPEYFVEAAYRVLQKLKNVRFVMAGSGDLKNKIEKKVNDIGIADKFTFPGFLRKGEINSLFSRTHLFVMPSVSEPFGIVPLEAMLSEVPVIISKQSGVSEIIKNAIKVDYWDVNAISDAIYGVLNYNCLSDLLSSKGRYEVNGLSWEKTGQQIHDVYKSVV
jgi:glycosyltransferase involved in cell wall biosynthesis